MTHLEEQLEALHEEVRDLTRAVRDLDHHIRGNGRPGLITRVSVLEDRSGRVSVIAGAVATVIAACVGAVVAFIK